MCFILSLKSILEEPRSWQGALINMFPPIYCNGFPLLWARNSYFSNVGTFQSLLPLPGGGAPSVISKEKYNGSSTL